MALFHVSAAQTALKNGLPDHDTDRKLRRRAKWREFKYEVSTDGIGTALSRFIHGETGK